MSILSLQLRPEAKSWIYKELETSADKARPQDVREPLCQQYWPAILLVSNTNNHNESNDMRIGYARVSTVEQNLDLQRSALKNAGCEQIIEDQGLSGSERNRPGLAKAIKLVEKGDTLVVWRLDRLGRSLVDLLDILKQLAENGAGFHSLTEAIDTNTSGGRLVFHMMGALAEFERNLISERTRAGMAAAKKAGKLVGRPRSLTASQVREAEAQISQGVYPINAIAKQLGVHPKTLKRAIDRTKRHGRVSADNADEP